ncbi:histidine phosphatase family protein [Thermoleophilia bacterium SCSIO 60948]|nr:histidine phosphatase family protein [Thermoleophilia bacterium SCSIO 60948]
MDAFTWTRAAERNEHCLIAIRHGTTSDNDSGIASTDTDVRLSAAGEEAARSLAPVLGSIALDAAYTSPLLRARRTAELALADLAITPEIDERLTEPAAGPFEGQSFDELWAGTHELSPLFDAYMDEEDPVAPEGAEPIAFSAAKAAEFLATLEAKPGRYVCFSHGGLLRIMACVFAGTDPKYSRRLKLDNCHALVLKWYPKPPHQVLAVNLPPGLPRNG